MFEINFLNEKKSIILLSLILLFIIVTITILSLVPPVSKDALVHHLAIPKLYLNHGGIYEIPFMDFSYYPMNLDLIYMIPLFFGNDIAPKFIHFSFALLTAFLIFAYLNNVLNKQYALLGAVFFLSIPIIIKLSITVYVDLGEIFFSFAALLLLIKWLNNGFKLKYLIYAGLMCGLALGTKYNGLITLLVLTLFIPYLCSGCGKNDKQRFMKSVGSCIIFFIISLAVFSPWMIRNYNWKGNPIYPLNNKVFNPPGLSVSSQAAGDPENDEVKQNSGFFTYRSMIYKENGWEIALLPVRIFFQGKDGDPQYFDGKLNPFLFILPFFAFYRLSDNSEAVRREKKIMLVFSLLFFSFAFFTAVLRIRYLAPIIPPLIILSVFGIKNLFKIVSTFKTLPWVQSGKALIVILLVFFLSLNGAYLINLYKSFDPFSYISGKISREDYISRFIPEYPALEYINNNLPVKSKVYLIFLGKRGYYCDRDYLFNMNIMGDLIKSSDNSEEIARGFHNRGITHILINYRIFERWMSSNFSEEKQRLTQDFFKKHADLLFLESVFGVNMLVVENIDDIE